MRQRKRQVPLARFRQDDFECRRRKVLELVNVERVGETRIASALHCGLRNGADEQRPGKARVLFAEACLGKIGDDDLAAGQTFTDIDRAMRLAPQDAKVGVGQKRTDLVLQRHQRLLALGRRPALELIAPEGEDGRVLYMMQ